MVTLLLRFQTPAVLYLIAALSLGIGMALFSTRKILRLEGRPSAIRRSGRARGQLKTLRPSWYRRRKRNARASRVSCTTKSASLFPPFWWSCEISRPV